VLSPLEQQVVDPDRIRVQAIAAPEGQVAPGMYWFKVLFETRSGRCCITAGEAQHLCQLNVDWVKRALINLAVQRGRGWLEDALVSRAGLMLHRCDAKEFSGRAADPIHSAIAELDEIGRGLG
jgi:hypothetical protein